MSRHYPAELLAAAKLDVAEAFQWYETRRQGLGQEFLLSLEACLAFLERQPLAYPEARKGTRKAKLRHFPFAVIYYIEQERVLVIAVHHSARDPEIWQERLP